MAVWQFKFSLVPTEGVVRHHGSLPSVLVEYRANEVGVEPRILDESEMPNYWEGIDWREHMISRVSQLLAPMNLLGTELLAFGEREGNKVDIWEDDIYCFIDARNVNLKLIELLMQIGIELHCKVVLIESGMLVDPDTSVVLDALRRSTAYDFASDPQRFLRRLASSKHKTDV